MAVGAGAGAAKSTTDNVRELYKNHPLRQETIFGRLRQQGKPLDSLTELDLALDEQAEITDQNHVGGLAFTAELAGLAGVTSASCVLDLGSGLGGSARVLAHLYGCRVHGVELSKERVQESEKLTRQVRLEALVTFECGDLLEMDVPRNTFDILWGQSSWTHFRDKEKFVRRWSEALGSRRRLALEDLYLKTAPKTTDEKRELDQFEHDAMSTIVEMQAWVELLRRCGFSVFAQDLSYRLVQDVQRQLHHQTPDRRGRPSATEGEKSGLLLKLASQGVLGYFRMVAS
jgi:SAM-dependent methyltransferase